MKIIGFRLVCGHLKQPVKQGTAAQPQSRDKGCAGAEVLWQSQRAAADATGQDHPTSLSRPIVALVTLDAATQHRLRLARSEALERALKAFGARFV